MASGLMLLYLLYPADAGWLLWFAIAVACKPFLHWFLPPRQADSGYVMIVATAATVFVFSDFIQHTVLRMGSSPGFAVSLLLAWIFCLLCLPGAADACLPLAFLSCLGIVALFPAPGTAKATLAATAVIMTILSGTFLFASHITHPNIMSATGMRRRLGRFSPHLAIAVSSLILMVTLAGWLRQHAAKISAGLEMNEDGNGVCELTSAPPRFQNRPVCTVLALEGKLPRYLGETAFTTYDNGRWINGTPCLTPLPKYDSQRSGKPIWIPANRCMVTMDANTPGVTPVPFGTLFERPASGNSGGRLARQQLSHDFIWSDKLWHNPRHPIPESFRELRNLPKLTGLAKLLGQRADSDLSRLQIILSFLSQKGVYDISRPFAPPVTSSDDDPIEAFIASESRGWCVHFASAAALMLRANGIPTRFVTGYVVDVKNEDTRQTVEVLDRAGHAWCEALINDGKGTRWIIVDPSPASAIAAMTSAPSALKWHIFRGGVLIVGLLLIWKVVHDAPGRTADSYSTAASSSASAPEQILAAWHRIELFFATHGILRPTGTTPREFAYHYAPPEQRQDVLIVTAAFERIRYMGYRQVNSEDLQQLHSATNRVLHSRLKTSRGVR